MRALRLRPGIPASALIVLGLLCSACATADPAFRAFWADAFDPGFKSSSNINSLISWATTGNYNAIIIEVLAYQDTGGTGHGAYWNSSIVPKASDISGGIDPLELLVSAGHAAGLEVHAWIVPFRVCTSWPPNGNSLLAAHPEWLMVPQADMDGGPARVDGKYTLDPGSPDVQEYLTSIIQELVTNYDIDGINFDYIRYTQTDAGYPADASYTKSSLARFQALEGYSGTPPPDGSTQWNDFRRRTISEFVRRSRAEIASIASNPQQPLRFTADLICWGDAPVNFQNSSAWARFQNWKYWMEQGWLDAGIPMNYKREYEASEASWYRDWVDAAIGWRYDRHIFCGQGNYLNRKVDSVTQLQYCLNAGADGTCNYSYYETADENMNGSPESDFTWYTYVASNIFTSTVETPGMPWRDPNTATEGTLWGQVVNGTTGEPIDGATVQVGGIPSVLTDGNGYYVVTLIPADPGGTPRSVSVFLNGCNQVIVSDVMVFPGEVVRQDIEMCAQWAGPGDMNEDGYINGADLALFTFCLQGPDETYVPGHLCINGDVDADDDVDMVDFTNFQIAFDGSE
jgi:uncharacterized lipoprotein YddW (UPF0748 family)